MTRKSYEDQPRTSGASWGRNESQTSEVPATERFSVKPRQDGASWAREKPADTHVEQEKIRPHPHAHSI